MASMFENLPYYSGLHGADRGEVRTNPHVTHRKSLESTVQLKSIGSQSDCLTFVLVVDGCTIVMVTVLTDWSVQYNSYSIFLLSPQDQLMVEGKCDKGELQGGHFKRERFPHQKTQEGLGETWQIPRLFFFKWPFCYWALKAIPEMKDFVRKITPQNSLLNSFSLLNWNSCRVEMGTQNLALLIKFHFFFF